MKKKETPLESFKRIQRESKVNKILSNLPVSRLVLPAFEDCREMITGLTEEAYQLLLKQPDEKKVIVMSVLIKFYAELKKMAEAGKTCG